MIELDRSRLPVLEQKQAGGNAKTSAGALTQGADGAAATSGGSSRAQKFLSTRMDSAPAAEQAEAAAAAAAAQSKGAPNFLNRLIAKLVPGRRDETQQQDGGPSFLTTLTAAGAGRVIQGLYTYLNGLGFESGGEFGECVPCASE
jgi:hypothetical protein